LLNLFDFLRSLPDGVRTFGILGFLMLGGKGKALVLIIGGFIDEIRSMMADFLMDFAEFNQKILEVRKSLFLVSDENFTKILNQNNQLVGIATNLKKPIKEYRQELESSNHGLDTTFGMAKGGAVSKGQPYVVGEQGAELFIPNQTGQITQSARGTGGNGGATTVNFNINTVDASGFEELLVRSRGTITQLINNAVNERGRESLI
jgi:hypothetical protein